jgi:uroporphyrinogen decarboxylase
MIPPFEEKVFEEDAENIVYRRGDGKVVKTRKDGTTMPNFIEYPVKTEEDFEKIKEKFNADSPERFPKEWNKLVAEYSTRTYPLQLGGGAFCGFYSMIREMMGVEESLYAFYDNPDFVT